MILRWLSNLLAQLVASQFYGKLTINFKGGEVVHVTKEESLKPPAGEPVES